MPELIPAAPLAPDDDTEHEHETDDVTGDPFWCPVAGCWWNCEGDETDA